MKVTTLTIFLSSIFLSSNVLAIEQKPSVEIYATGGTIAGSSASNLDTTNYKAGSIGVNDLINAVPELKNIANISGEQIANVASSNIGQVELLKISKSISQKLKNKNINGAVVTHGTDTTEETAFFLDLTINSIKPVVVVGAMRPATAISADGPMNLLEAVSLATNKESENRGVMIVLNDRIGSAFYTTKTNSTTLDTFKAVEQGYLGTFIGVKPKFYYSAAKPINKPFFDISNINTLPKVEIIYAHQDQDTSLIDAAISSGAKGIVIAGNGNGSISDNLKAKTVELMKKGIPVVRSTRTGSGYVSAKEEGIGSGYYNPQKARIILTLALAKADNIQKIRSYFED